jgi:pimeloyl-ACP methyl ester carboxylesterase
MTTAVLIHGGATTARCWDLVLERLPDALAVNVPGREDRPADLHTLTVEQVGASIAADIESAAIDDVVLVAHSSGGLFVPEIIGRLGAERVRAILLNAASVPPEGGNGLDCMQPKHRELTILGLQMVAEEGLVIDTPFPSRDSMRRSSGEELDEPLVDYMLERSVPESISVYTQPVHWSVAADIPTTYVFNLLDRAVPIDLQREMASRLPREPCSVELESGHLPMVVRPDMFASLIAGLSTD